MTNVNLKKGDKIYSSYEGAVVEHELVAAGPKYLTIKGNHIREHKVVRETMLSDNDRGHKTQYYATREELIEAVTKASAWNELSKIVRDRYSAPNNLTAAQLMTALAALKGE